MRTSDIKVGKQYTTDWGGAVVTVLNTTTTKVDYYDMEQFEEAQQHLRDGNTDPYWRGAARNTVCVRFTTGMVRWLQARDIIGSYNSDEVAA